MANALFTALLHTNLGSWPYAGLSNDNERPSPRNRETGNLLMHLPILPNRKSYDDARALIALFGEDAGAEAANRADASRDVGNHIHFCHWRQIERMIVLLGIETALGTIH